MPRPINFWSVVTDGKLPYDWNDATHRLIWIVSVATHHPPAVNIQSGVRCSGPRDSDGCDGRLLLRREETSPPMIRWACAKCGAENVLWGWDEMEYDARSQEPIGALRDGEVFVSLNFDEYDTLIASVSDDPEAPSQRVRCSGVVDPSDSNRVIVRGTKDEIDHALDYILGESLHVDPEAEAILNMWHRFDGALAASGDAERHDRRDDRIRSFMRERRRPESTSLSWTFPRILEGYAIVEPQRARVLRGEWDAMRDSDRP